MIITVMLGEECKDSVGIAERKNPPGKPRRGRETSIKMNLEETSWEIVD
jgi:hypothetical protein